ncbi:amino acid ABC transporter substrate-binding protein, partial [Piscirickettsia litoralis]|uniref:amino acid ABC transporter substrate-binding protein n=1 Tax=Piscirickettsia litoralis TaxID=1891921 RepID=UPI00138F9E09
FQGATGYFGHEFYKVSRTKKGTYQELGDMSILPELLVKKRYSAVVLDYYIFYYFYRLNDKNRDINIFDEHYIIDPVHAGVAFHSEKLRDKFNKTLKKYLSGEHDKIIFNKYLGNIEK